MITAFPEFTLAAVQAAPVYLNRDASTDKACDLIAQAAAAGADLAVFGESWIPGYPFFHAFALTPAGFPAAADYLANGVEIPSPTTDKLCAAARRAGIDVIIGVGELDPSTHGTIYCTALFIGREGVILGKHRKLKPTASERVVWGEGDGSTLRVYERPYGRISGLNCWEHQMVLPGYALIAQGTQIHAATWPGYEVEQEPPVPGWPRQTLLSRAFAAQGACYVVAAAGLLRPEDVPERYREVIRRPMTGDSVIISPTGEVLAGPLHGEEGILTARGSLAAVIRAKVLCDTAGHYSRPDVLRLLLNRSPREVVRESGEPERKEERPLTSEAAAIQIIE